MPGEEPDRAAFAADFHLGDWLVEPSLDRLSRNGTVRRLRPQLTNLLVLLARNAGRTVSKDEILAKVWDGQFVAESGMTRCIAEIRQALDDPAREPKVIETIPKRGYRLVAPVAFLPPADGRPPTPEAPSPGPAAAFDQAILHASVLSARFWHVARRLAMAGGSVAVAAVLLALTWGAAGWSRSPVLTNRDAVLLADVTNSTGDAAFDRTLKLALAVQLGQAPYLRILSEDHVRTALTLMGRPHSQPVVGAVALEVCRREGAAVLLAGSIARLGSHYAVGIEAVACRTGESIGHQLLEVPSKDDVLDALGTAAGRIRRTLGESRASLQRYDVPIVQATTPSLDALKALSLGDLSRDHARLADALAFYRRATELDPQFALAWARRGAAAYNLGESASDERFGAVDEPTFAFTKAYELRERASEPERFYIVAHYSRLVEGDPYKAVEIYEMWRRSYPGSIVPPVNLASLHANTFGRYDVALPEAQEGVRLAPYSSLANKMLVTAYLGLNRPDDARRALRDAADHGVGDVLWHALAFQVAFGVGDAAAMAEHVRWASSGAAHDATAPTVLGHLQALAAASAGRLREGRGLWREATASAAPTGSPSNRARLELARAETEALLGETGRARAAADAALALDRRGGTLLSAAVVFALCGDHARAQGLLDEAVHRDKEGICSKYVWRPVAQALVEAGSGRTEQALQTLRQVAPFERGHDFDLAPLGVRASIEQSAGRATAAAATFQELLRLRLVAPISPWVPYGRLGLARALAAAGDLPGSRAAYDTLIEGMPHADADAPLLLAARRERAALAGR